MKKIPAQMVARWFRLGAGCLVLAIVFTSAGCEPLRKKFIRKKKEGQFTSETIPIMVPEEYPVAARSVESLYRQNYSLVLVWLKEMTIAAEENASDKKLAFTYQKMVSQISQLKEFLQPAVQEKWGAIQAMTRAMEKGVNQPQELRNKMQLVKQVRELDKKIRKDLRPTQVMNSLVREVPVQP